MYQPYNVFGTTGRPRCTKIGCTKNYGTTRCTRNYCTPVVPRIMVQLDGIVMITPRLYQELWYKGCTKNYCMPVVPRIMVQPVVPKIKARPVVPKIMVHTMYYVPYNYTCQWGLLGPVDRSFSGLEGDFSLLVFFRHHGSNSPSSSWSPAEEHRRLRAPHATLDSGFTVSERVRERAPGHGLQVPLCAKDAEGGVLFFSEGAEGKVGLQEEAEEHAMFSLCVRRDTFSFVLVGKNLSTT